MQQQQLQLPRTLLLVCCCCFVPILYRNCSPSFYYGKNNVRVTSCGMISIVTAEATTGNIAIKVKEEEEHLRTSSSIEPTQRPTTVSRDIDNTNHNQATATKQTTSTIVSESTPLIVVDDDDDDDDNTSSCDIILLDNDDTIESKHSTTSADIKNNNTNTTTTNENNNDDDDDSSILVISLVDGTLIGLSRTTGRTVWKQKQQQQHHDTVGNNNNNKDDDTTTTTSATSNDSAINNNPHPLVKPLVSTTTTVHGSNNNKGGNHLDRNIRTIAVPSILDGKVYLTSTSKDCSAATSSYRHQQRALDIDNNIDDEMTCNYIEDTITTSIRQLIHRTPFIDYKNHNRIYTSQRQSIAVAIHSKTGIPIRTITTTGATSSSSSAIEADPIVAISNNDHSSNDNNDNDTSSDDDTLWIGRSDYTISIHEPNTGELDVQFTMAEMMSIHDMVLMDNTNSNNNNNHQQRHDALRQYLLPSSGYKIDNTVADEINVGNTPENQIVASSAAIHKYGVIATPNGHIAYRNLRSGKIVWVAEEAFINTPAVYAFDAKLGHTIPIEILPDTISPNGSMEYISNELQKQLYERNNDYSRNRNNPYESLNEPVFGSLPGSGQIYAIPLLQRGPSSTVIDHDTFKYGYDTIPDAARAYVSGNRFNSQYKNRNHYHEQQQQQTYSSHCHPNSPYYPRCLSFGGNGHDPYSKNHYQHGQNNHNRQFRNTFTNSLPDMRTYTDQTEDDSGAIVPFYHPDYGYQYIPPDHFYTINPEWNDEYRRRRRFKKKFRLVVSWLLPTIVAVIFVTSFELGRRKKSKLQMQSDSNIVTANANQLSSTSDEGLIQVDEDVILGHGGHGTIVYKGMLEGRQVAVKRMLKTYNASAEREISLLIESDGHPNVVRYHLKEARGDFVYLALELCDLSLHDLIGHIRARLDRFDADSAEEKKQIFRATKSVLFQITKGIEHLHRLRIVHRDLKPANILLANMRTHKSSKTDSMHNSICDTFERGEYIAKISDMGLGKQLVGQSSYGGASLYNDSSLRGESSRAQSSIIGIGPGSVGWQAPEVMKLRIPSDMSTKSDDASNINQSGSEFSPLDVPSNNRTSRTVDIFSLGCIFFSTLIPGSHPFGEWYEREANIMHNRPNLAPLELLSLEAYDLISWMLQRDPHLRPTAKQICDHPFFWSPGRRLSLLCDLSDRLEQDAVNATALNDTSFNSKLLAVEKNAIKVVGTSWDRVLDPDLINNVQKFRSYDPSSIRDLLRLIRNKFHHFDELPETFKASIGSKPEDLSQYFDTKFPRLLLHAFYVCQAIYDSDDVLSTKYSIFSVKPVRKATVGTNDALQRNSNNVILVETNNRDAVGETIGSITNPSPCADIIEPTFMNGQEQRPIPELVPEELSVIEETEDDLVQGPSFVAPRPPPLPASLPVPVLEEQDDNGVIVWFGSNTAKTFQCRGWNRSDDEWQHQSDMIATITASSTARRRDAHLMKCIQDDPKYRTRLCSHWDNSYGTFCPMRKKNKCIFAHGPIELRVKENKRLRWGKLVDDDGNCTNVKSSGGEDTYGAARSIESERQQQQQPKVDGGSNSKQQRNSNSNNSTKSKGNGKGKPTSAGGATTKKKVGSVQVVRVNGESTND